MGEIGERLAALHLGHVPRQAGPEAAARAGEAQRGDDEAAERGDEERRAAESLARADPTVRGVVAIERGGRPDDGEG